MADAPELAWWGEQGPRTRERIPDITQTREKIPDVTQTREKLPNAPVTRTPIFK
jgi:hypothetical protein